MPIETPGAMRSPMVATCVVILGLLAYWMAQPPLPGWACAASLPAAFPPQLLPVRASPIGAGILSVLLAILIVGPLLRPLANAWLGGMSGCTAIAVSVILLSTVVAHFLVPQP